MIKFFRKIRQNLLSEGKSAKYFKYALGEIILVVIGILIAVQINNQNEIRKNNTIESKLLKEISIGLNQDLSDITLNMSGHKAGLKACDYWRKIVTNKKVDTDSIAYYYHYLTRDFISIQNISGYQSLKSRGLELVTNESLRIEIIKLYEQDYSSMHKLEEEYQELQFQENYFKEINQIISPHLKFDDDDGDIASISFPLDITENEQKMMLSFLWKIKKNRQFVLNVYVDIEQNVNHLQSNIKNYIEKD